jgi:hypothetical protein
VSHFLPEDEGRFNPKMAVFWVVAPCSDRPDDGGSKYL